MYRSKTAFALAVLLVFGSLSRAQDKDALDLTAEQFRKLFEDGFKDEKKKQEIATKRAIPDFPYTLEPKDIDYTYDAAKKEVVKLEWRYRAAKAGDAELLKTKLGNVISVVLGQTFTPAEVKKLQDAVKPVPFGNAPPKIEAQNLTLAVARGRTGSLPFAVSDVETPAAKLQVAFAADAAVEPWLSLTGTGSERALKVVVPAGAAGPDRASIRLTVTDEDKATASVTVTLRLSVVEQSPMPPEPARMAPGTYFPPVAFAYAGPGTQAPRIVIWGPPYSPPGFGSTGGAQNWSGASRAGSDSVGAVRAPASVPTDRVIPWQELVRGQTEQDWATLYDAGYRKYWAGQYAQAREYCAAAAELKNDPRAWYFLALSHDALGERERATKAANYAAALALLRPQTATETTDALRAVQGALRDRLFQLQAETTTGGRHLALRTPRPELPGARPDGAGTARAGR